MGSRLSEGDANALVNAILVLVSVMIVIISLV